MKKVTEELIIRLVEVYAINPRLSVSDGTRISSSSSLADVLALVFSVPTVLISS